MLNCTVTSPLADAWWNVNSTLNDRKKRIKVPLTQQISRCEVRLWKDKNHWARKDWERSSSISVSLWEHNKTTPLLRNEKAAIFGDYRDRNPIPPRKSPQRSTIFRIIKFLLILNINPWTVQLKPITFCTVFVESAQQLAVRIHLHV